MHNQNTFFGTKLFIYSVSMLSILLCIYYVSKEEVLYKPDSSNKELNLINVPEEPEGGGAPAFCHNVASAASRLTYTSFTSSRIFSGFISVWMILHFVCK